MITKYMDMVKSVSTGFARYAYASIARWVTPRKYLVAYTYEEQSGKLLHESKILRMWCVDPIALITYLEKGVSAKTLHIDAISELCVSNSRKMSIPLVQCITQEALHIANQIKVENSASSSLPNTDKVNTEETPLDISGFLKNH